ncbi:DNA-(apurinic or apyrimidinic site) lyase [Hyphodiscus hymeniophilus]|uniref:DNA-(apurinic or apyrimidinic site) lyase n=1 Tax=Hyphodiscus hymeniophilus TaxID=353542 RepID=A0A9P6VPC1_9HELO|nr:DNA-(apurinic or apyrimidinic site) lyase [Hyphodiscus hymeniophilus]
MGNLRISEWRKLPSFRWKKLRGDEWVCVLQGRILCLKQDSSHLHYQTIRPNNAYPITPPSSAAASKVGTPSDGGDDTESLLRHYLNLTPDLTALYEYWSSLDSNFKRRAPKFTGVRILKQDAWEALVGFICSHIDEQPFHDFPPPDALTGPGVESHLRELGFGYRAGYIAKTAKIVANERPAGWLHNLCNPAVFDASLDDKALPEGGREGYRKAHEELLQLQGVGPKVADCVCLMGLGWGESVPVDTHVWQIAQRDYKFGKGKHKSLTKATYDAVGNHFRSLWGKEAGWAHSVLFAADLKTFSERLTKKIEVDFKEVEIKQEDGSVLESKIAVKREYTLDDVKEEVDEGKAGILIESSRTQRAKRRRI